MFGLQYELSQAVSPTANTGLDRVIDHSYQIQHKEMKLVTKYTVKLSVY